MMPSKPITSSTPAILEPANMAKLATLLGEWAYDAQCSAIEETSSQRYVRSILVYAGNDLLLKGAAIEGLFDTYWGAALIHWSSNVDLHITPENRSRYLPDLLPYGQRKAWPRSSIKISATKSVAVVARELERRLLSYYLPAYRLAMERLQSDEAQHLDDIALAETLASVLGCHVPHLNETIHLSSQTRLGILSVDHGRVHIERGFSISPEQARELCAMAVRWEQTSTS